MRAGLETLDFRVEFLFLVEGELFDLAKALVAERGLVPVALETTLVVGSKELSGLILDGPSWPCPELA